MPPTQRFLKQTLASGHMTAVPQTHAAADLCPLRYSTTTLVSLKMRQQRQDFGYFLVRIKKSGTYPWLGIGPFKEQILDTTIKILAAHNFLILMPLMQE